MADPILPRPFWNDGGPLLLLPPAAVPLWEGADPPSSGRVVSARSRCSAPVNAAATAPATDYDRACDVDPESAAMLAVGPSWVVVLGTAAAQSAWWLPGPGPGELCAVGVEVLDDDDPSRLRTLAAEQPREAWRPLAVGVEVQAGGLLLAHAAVPPVEARELAAYLVEPGDQPEAALIGDALRAPLPAGVYGVSTCDVATAAGELLTFVKFAPAVAAP